MGGDLDGYNSYAQRGNLPTLQHVLSEGVAMFPNLKSIKNVKNLGRDYGYVYGWISSY